MTRLHKNFVAIFALFALAMMILSPVASSYAPAQGTTPAEIERDNSDVNKIFHKLGRGVVNVLTGWLEIPKQTAKEWRRTDPFTGTVLGLIKGLWLGIARTFAGFYEIISFPFPIPRNYEPIMLPEFVLPTVWGERLPLFRDEFVGTSESVDNAVDYGTSTPNRRSY